MENTVTFEKIVSLCKRRGFIFPGSEIYGGLANTWDYGPLGVELKNNIKQLWWSTFVHQREDIVGLDSAILMNPKVWYASGHVQNFSDPLLDCKKCKNRFRGDKLIEEAYGMEVFSLAKILLENSPELQNMAEFLAKKESLSIEQAKDSIHKEIQAKNKDLLALVHYIVSQSEKITCPKCESRNFTEPRQFNLMFKTHQGVTEDSSTEVYLRPETAQGIFVNFKNVVTTSRKKLPFGIAQIGKAFRNEITPGNFTFRTREFEQMEIEYFLEEKDWETVFPELEQSCWDFYNTLGINSEHLRWRDHDKDELSHYSKKTKDIEYLFPFGWGELMGLAYRTNFDLTQHQTFSKEKLEYMDPQSQEKKGIPHVIEPSFGCDRTVLTVLMDAYKEEEVNGNLRTVLKLKPSIAPVKAAIFPLQKEEDLENTAKSLYKAIKARIPQIEYDNAGNIGKMYRRQDEIGTPYCITIDHQTLEDDTITIRERDSMQQQRISKDKLLSFLQENL